jgi:hypothetical protein
VAENHHTARRRPLGYNRFLVNRIRVFPALAAAILGGCANAPESYPPPIQRPSLPDAEVSAGQTLITMDAPNAESFFVRDISPHLEGGAWRWTNERPELRFLLPPSARLKAVLEFHIVPATFEKTGPVAVSVYVNGTLIGRISCPRPGPYFFRQLVPSGVLKAGEYNILAAEPNKIYVSDLDGAKLGFTLYRAGFAE